MKQNKSNVLFFVLYDSITNSIFEGQILGLLKKKTYHNPNNKIILISFENKTISSTLQKQIQDHSIDLIIVKRPTFLGLWSLIPAYKALHIILKKYNNFSIIARGPHAGWLSLQATKNTNCEHITIQARGLLAEEYAYVHQHKKAPLSWLHTLRKKHFSTLEKYVYGYHEQAIPLTFEAVSETLKHYIITYFGTEPEKVSIAYADIPEPIEINVLRRWRTVIRTRLGIAENAHVYCYNGSAKPWQCPEEIITFFKQEQEKNNKSFLLILSQDKRRFERLLQKAKIDPSRFYVVSIAHHEVFNYLAACDTGLLFREKNIINWVSRPTKALEYQAAGLNIIHNNTIGFLQQ